MAKKAVLKAVVVRAYSGVFFGYLAERTATSCRLEKARQVWSWKSDGLSKPVLTCGDIALRGVGRGSKVSDPVMTELEDCKAFFDASEEAIRCFEGWGQ